MQGAAMTIDERLDRLTERHEALTQSVELLQVMQHDNEERWEKRFGQVTRNFEIVLDSIKRLENIAAAHEERLDDLEH
jgi:abortive infection bacteriophage resistance protein